MSRATRGACGASCAEITLGTKVAPTGWATPGHRTGRPPHVSEAGARGGRMKNKCGDVNGGNGCHGQRGERAGRRAPRSP